MEAADEWNQVLQSDEGRTTTKWTALTGGILCKWLHALLECPNMAGALQLAKFATAPAHNCFPAEQCRVHAGPFGRE